MWEHIGEGVLVDIFMSTSDHSTLHANVKERKAMSSKASKAGSGFGLGALLAVILSWSVNHSVIWCIIHFFCGWIYVFYWLIFR